MSDHRVTKLFSLEILTWTIVGVAVLRLDIPTILTGEFKAFPLPVPHTCWTPSLLAGLRAAGPGGPFLPLSLTKIIYAVGCLCFLSFALLSTILGLRTVTSPSSSL